MKNICSSLNQWTVTQSSLWANIAKIALSLLIVLLTQISFSWGTEFETTTESTSRYDCYQSEFDHPVTTMTLSQKTSAEYSVDITGALPLHSAYVYVQAFGISHTRTGDVYLNNELLGQLQGFPEKWSVTEFTAPLASVYQGTNTIKIQVDEANSNVLEGISWCYVSIDKEVNNRAKFNDIQITDKNVIDDNLSLNVQTTVEVRDGGNYLVSFVLVNPDGMKSNPVTVDFSSTDDEVHVLEYIPSYPLSSPTGTYTVEATLFTANDGKQQQDYIELSFKHDQDTKPTPPKSVWEISAEPLVVEADGTSASVITVQAFDTDGNELPSTYRNIYLTTTLGTLSEVSDHGNSSYTATLTSIAAGKAKVSGQVNGQTIPDTVDVEFIAGEADATTSIISASPTTIVADGMSYSTITVKLKDAYGNNLTTGGDMITLTSTLGTLSNIMDHDDGSYSATLTSTTIAGLATVTGTLNETPMSSTTAVNFVGALPSNSVSNALTATPSQLTADGVSQSTINIQLLNSEGNPLLYGGFDVQLTTDKGALSDPVDNQDGTYSAIFTAPEKIKALQVNATIDSTIDGEAASSLTIKLTLNPLGDEDDDGIPNQEDGTGDNDGDGTPNFIDIDSDDDGILDMEEGQDDIDGDSIPNYLDSDSDGDGLSDREENSGLELTGSDQDNDGLDDVFDTHDQSVGNNEPNRSISDGIIPVSDVENDGTPNYLDTDSDGDGILDTNEKLDFNGDGTPDYLQKPIGLETAPRGGGSFGVWMLVLMTGLLAFRRHGRFLAAVLAAALGLSGVANAGTCPKSSSLFSYHAECWYAGLGLGFTRLEPDENQSDWGANDKNNYGYKGFIGYELNHSWQVEFDYSQLGKVDVAPRNPFLGGGRDITYKVPAIWALHKRPIQNTRWSFFAKAGVSSIQNSADDIVEYDKVTSAQLAIGIGAQRPLINKWIVRAEIDSFDKDADYAGLTLARYFGSSQSTPILVDAPVPIAPEPIFVAPPKVETINLNVRFRTASADIEERYIPEIKKLATYMQKHPNTEISIEGHTDNVGSDEYNKKLSERRAASVRTLLIERFGIPVERLLSVGHGESLPIASNDGEVGRAKNRRVVAILPSEDDK